MLVLKKIFPNTIKIEIYEKNPSLYYKKKEELLSDKDEIVDFKTLENYKNLPLYLEMKNFKTLYTNLKNKFSIKTIEKFFCSNQKGGIY